jgi:hypothetical protein
MRFSKLVNKLQALSLLLAMPLMAFAGRPATANCPDNNRVFQSFEFGSFGGKDSDIQILSVYYGIPGCPPNYDSEKILFNGKPMQGTSIHGFISRAWMIYVKWRVKSTSAEYEEKINLQNRLPKDMTRHEVNFKIEVNQLTVYLITPERRPPGMAPNDPEETQYLKTLTIFPVQPNYLWVN